MKEKDWKDYIEDRAPEEYWKIFEKGIPLDQIPSSMDSLFYKIKPLPRIDLRTYHLANA